MSKTDKMRFKISSLVQSTFSKNNKPIEEDLVVIDSIFPQKEPFAFRNTEINEYFNQISNISSYTMYPMDPGADAWFKHGYGMDKQTYKVNKEGYLRHYHQNKKRLHYLDPKRKYSFKLAYSFFLSETYTLLPFYEENKIPFIFVLYPGGGFGLNNESSDKMLRKIFSSRYCKGVIVTQKITENYLIKQKICTKQKITYIYGSIVQFRLDEIEKKKLYKRDKQTFDICFVAAKYTDKGIDKGYDLFVETAKRLSVIHDSFRFHVVGGFSEEDLDVSDIKTKITFYGYRRPDFLKEFYSRMDIFLSPNRPYKIFPGNFDGFPLGMDAGYSGVALFVSDELGLNQYFKTGEDIVIVKLDPEDIARKINSYFEEPTKLYKLSKRGQKKCQKLFGIDFQVKERIRLFEKHVVIKYID